jgi:hypothetical protein
LVLISEFLLSPTQKRKHKECTVDFMEAILFVLGAQSTDQENSGETMHKQETQNVVSLQFAVLHNCPTAAI